MDAMVAEVEYGKAGIDLRFRPECCAPETRIGPIERRSLRACHLAGVPGQGRLSPSSLPASDIASAGIGEQRRIVDGRSSRVILECRRGTPTVDAGDGAIFATRSCCSGVAGRSREERLEECDEERPKRRVLEADRLRDEAKSSTCLDRDEVEWDLSSGPEIQRRPDVSSHAQRH